MSFKIAFIGAGSVGFTRTLLKDILSVPEFEDVEIAFHDIHEGNLEKVTQLCQKDIAANGLSIRIQSSTDRREVLRDARYIVCTVRVGGLEAFAHDVQIPLKYGVDQCVGDTLCAGGLMYAQRGIPVILGICRDIADVSEKNALLLNYANPMAMMCWAANKYCPEVRTVGLCHGVQHGHIMIARAFGLPKEEVDIVCAGINHQTWYTRIEHKGKDLTGDLLEALTQTPDIRQTQKVRIDMLRRFGYFSTESNGHFSEYVPWYRNRREKIPEWIDLSSWYHGETGGYLRHCRENHDWDASFQEWLEGEPEHYEYESRSVEHGSYVLEGLETGRPYRGHFNRVNHGVIKNLPDDAVIEAPGYVDRLGINLPVVGELPLGCAAVCNMSIQVQRLGVEAAVHGDDQLLRQAMMLDPLTGAVCQTPEIAQMTDEMLVALAPWLPQYEKAVKEARERLNHATNRPTQGGHNETGPLASTSDV